MAGAVVALRPRTEPVTTVRSVVCSPVNTGLVAEFISSNIASENEVDIGRWAADIARHISANWVRLDFSDIRTNSRIISAVYGLAAATDWVSCSRLDYR